LAAIAIAVVVMTLRTCSRQHVQYADGKEQTERDWSVTWLEYPNLANSANVLEAATLPYSISPLQLSCPLAVHYRKFSSAAVAHAAQ